MQTLENKTMQNNSQITSRSAFPARAASLFVFSLAAICLTSTTAFSAIIAGTDYTTTPSTANTFTSIDVITPITGEDSVYLAFTLDSDYDTFVDQNGSDLFGFYNSDGDEVFTFGESGGGSTQWRMRVTAVEIGATHC